MTGERRRWRWVSALVLVVAWTAGVGAEDGLDTARRLYAAAAYDDALKALDRLQPDPAGRATVDIQQQRLLCLVALGRSAEAEQAMTAIVEADPLYVPAAATAPPRVRAAFQDVRAKLVPAIARAEYERARQAYEAADYDTAAAGFTRVLAIVGDGPSADPVVRDMAVLAAGFKALSEKALAAPPVTPAAPQPAAAPVVAAARPARIYDGTYPGVAVPHTIRQEVPQWPRVLGPPPNRDAVLEVIINAEGLVESARVMRGVHRSYDQLLLAAASTWSYSPAQLDGERVKFRKVMKLSFR